MNTGHDGHHSLQIRLVHLRKGLARCVGGLLMSRAGVLSGTIVAAVIVCSWGTIPRAGITCSLFGRRRRHLLGGRQQGGIIGLGVGPGSDRLVDIQTDRTTDSQPPRPTPRQTNTHTGT